MKQKIRCLVTLFALSLAVTLGVVKAEAATVTQTAQTQNSITVAWTQEKTATSYQVYLGADSSSAALVATVKPAQTSYTFTGLQPGTKYYVKIAYTKSGSSTASTAGYLYNARTLPGTVTGINQTKWYHWIKSVDFEWTKQTGADGYEYIVTDSNGVEKARKTTSSSAGGLSIENNHIYTLKVRSYAVINGVRYESEWSPNAYLFEQPYLNDSRTIAKKNYVSNGKLKITWPKTKGADGYDVYVSTKPKSGYKKVKSVKASKNTITIKKVGKKKVNGNKKYYVYVVAKKNVGGVTYTSGQLYYWYIKGKNIYGQYYF